MLSYRGRIGEELVDAGLVTKDQVEAALRLQRERGGKTVENLVALGHLTIEKFVSFQKSRPGMPSLDLSNYSLPKDVVELIPRDFAIQYQLVPIDKMGKTITVGMSFPLDQPALDALEKLTNLRARPVLCSMEDVQSAITKYYPAGEEEIPLAMEYDGSAQLAADLRLGGLANMIRQIETLPGLPETVLKIREALLDESVTIADVAAAIRRDPPVAAKLIGVANSAALALSQKVESVDAAASLMGLRETYALVASMAVMEQFSGGGAYVKNRFWVDAQQCATIAVAITRARGQRQTAVAYSAALLHDIGRLLLATMKPEQYALINSEQDHIHLMDAERESFGLAHPEAGFLLAESWNLPSDLAEAIRFHHDHRLARHAPQLAATVQVSHTLLSGRGRDGDVLAVYVLDQCPEAIACLELSPEVLVPLCGIVQAFEAVAS